MGVVWGAMIFGKKNLSPAKVGEMSVFFNVYRVYKLDSWSKYIAIENPPIVDCNP